MQFNFKYSRLGLLVATATLAGGTATASQDAASQSKTVELTILHTNDNHGHFWRNKHGEYGMSARKTIIDGVRKEVAAKKGHTLLFSGGDINTGVPESDMQDAKPDFVGMNVIGYDAMAVGNHEFDKSPEVLMKQASWAKFPFLAANIYNKKTGKRLFKPFKIYNEGGVKIAVIGLTTEDTAKIGNPEYIGHLEFRNPVKELKTLIPEIKKEYHPDLIFAITHMGHYQDGKFGINAPGDVTLARSLPKGSLNMIIGGHSQNPVCMDETLKDYDKNFKPGAACRPDQQNGTWIVQAYEWGKYVGRADFKYQDGKLVLDSYKLIPVNLTQNVVKKTPQGEVKVREFVGEKVVEDPKLLNILKPYQAIGEKALQAKVGEVNGLLEGSRNIVRFQQTNLGNLLAYAQAAKVNADFGIMNSGGVRDSIEPGIITYKDILKVQPFSNTVAKVSMKGSALIKYLDVVANKSVDSGAYPQFWGISMLVRKDGVHNVKIQGEPINPNKVYTFSIPKFNAVGGDGYPKLTDFIDTGFVDADVLKQFINTHSPLNIKDYDPKNQVIFDNK